MKVGKNRVRRPLLSTRAEIRIDYFLIVLLFLGLAVLNTHFISQERVIYFWDTAGYWQKYRELGDYFLAEPLAAVKTTFLSIRKNEYNLLPALLLLPARLILGNSRIDYILANTILLSFPFILFFATFFRMNVRSLGTTGDHRHAFVFAAFWLGLSPQLWVPVLAGYPDCGGLILAMIVLLLFIRKPFHEQRYATIILMALLLCLMVVFRRWYAYWVVGFLAGAAFEVFIPLAVAWKTDFRACFPAVCRFCALCGAAFTFFLLLAGPIAITMLTTDYGDIYSGYKYLKSSYAIALNLIAFFGSLTIYSAILGVLPAIRERSSRRTAIVLFCQFWFSLLLFNRTQSMNPHHLYILLPAIIFFSCFFLYSLATTVRVPVLRVVVCCAIFALQGANWAIVLLPAAAARLAPLEKVLSQLRHYPTKRGDIPELSRIIDYLEKKIDAPSIKVYVLASGQILNDDILRNACDSLKAHSSICRKVVPAAHVDKRDGLPVDLFQSSYVITTDPVEMHLDDPADQQVVGKIRSMLVNGEGFGKNYQMMDVEFKLDNNVKVHIYQRLDSPFLADDLRAVSDFFTKLYPAHREKFIFPVAAFKELTE